MTKKLTAILLTLGVFASFASAQITAVPTTPAPALPVLTPSLPISFGGVFAFNAGTPKLIAAAEYKLWSLPFLKASNVSLQEQALLGSTVGTNTAITGGTTLGLAWASPFGLTGLTAGFDAGLATSAGSKPFPVFGFSVRGSLDLSKVFKF